MKTLLSLIIIVLVSSFSLTQTAEAGRLRIGYTTHYHSGHASCGCPIPYYKIFRGYASCGTPIWKHHRSSIVHNCRRNKIHYNHYRPRYLRDRGYRNSRHYGRHTFHYSSNRGRRGRT